MKKIYGIRDVVAQAFVSSMLMVFGADAAAVRWFQDGLLQEGSLLNKHPGDFELVLLGDLSDKDGISLGDFNDSLGFPRVVLTGAAWLAAQKPAEDGQLSLLRKEA